MRLLCVHWLLDGGRFKEKLWDIYFAVDNRPKDFDWDRCLKAGGENRRRWIVCSIGLAHRYYNLNIDDLPFSDELREIPSWIISCIEREWRREPLEPILTSLHDKGLLLRQIIRRIPPNPIRATIEAEGDLYGARRGLYQVAVLGRRFGPFIGQTMNVVKRKLGRSKN